jgi:dihydrolipoamide dehydrogenase
VIGSGVTGVEFVHMFKSFGSEVTLIVSRQQVLPSKDPEVAAALEADFLSRGVRLFKGARAQRIERTDDGIRRQCRAKYFRLEPAFQNRPGRAGGTQAGWLRGE